MRLTCGASPLNFSHTCPSHISGQDLPSPCLANSISQLSQSLRSLSVQLNSTHLSFCSISKHIWIVTIFPSCSILSLPKPLEMAMASSFLLPGVRRAVPKLSRSFFACHKCPQKLSPQPAIDAVRKTLENPSINARYMISRGFKSTTSHLAAASTTSSLPSLRAPGTQNIVQRAIKATEAAKGATGFFPEQNSKTVGYWLLGSAASVFGLVVFGGLTRLTESGYVHNPP